MKKAHNKRLCCILCGKSLGYVAPAHIVIKNKQLPACEQCAKKIQQRKILYGLSCSVIFKIDQQENEGRTIMNQTHCNFCGAKLAEDWLLAWQFPDQQHFRLCIECAAKLIKQMKEKKENKDAHPIQ